MAAANLTILDIAKEAGVSPATVSRVLSKHTNVSPSTAQRVREVVDKYSYQPNSIARGLLQRQSHVLGIIMPDIKHPYYASVFSAAQREAGSAGSVVQLYRLAYNSAITDDFISHLIERRLDGALLCGGFIEPSDPKDLSAVLKHLQQYMPIVTICPPIQGLDCVNIFPDLEGGIKKEVGHLARLGHKRIAFIGATQETRSVGERELGFRMEAERLSVKPVLHYENIHTPAMGESSVQRLLGSLPRSAWPTALIVVNDLMALGVLKGLRRMGLRVPEDIAVVGSDNQFFSEYTDPPLTTLDLNAEELGQLSMRQLLHARDSKPASYSQVRDPMLIVRESCGASLSGRTAALLEGGVYA
ncbi:MAG: LacI family transcriptional regulator [Oscillospiraceae bacterium]|jgi:DNA-binding LacI/PurR family transcriptional regulator|nr:LacI family transcriptional regulator [Oscillospiraceae bacterium]